jgi:hypothetical protein
VSPRVDRRECQHRVLLVVRLRLLVDSLARNHQRFLLVSHLVCLVVNQQGSRQGNQRASQLRCQRVFLLHIPHLLV